MIRSKNIKKTYSCARASLRGDGGHWPGRLWRHLFLSCKDARAESKRHQDASTRKTKTTCRVAVSAGAAERAGRGACGEVNEPSSTGVTRMQARDLWPIYVATVIRLRHDAPLGQKREPTSANLQVTWWCSICHGDTIIKQNQRLSNAT